MKQGNALQVLYDGKLVGTLAMTADHKAAFQYSEEWIENGFPISPFSLPLKEQVFVPTKDFCVAPGMRCFRQSAPWWEPVYFVLYGSVQFFVHTHHWQCCIMRFHYPGLLQSCLL